jgi:hypothetical protein
MNPPTAVWEKVEKFGAVEKSGSDSLIMLSNSALGLSADAGSVLRLLWKFVSEAVLRGALQQIYDVEKNGSTTPFSCLPAFAFWPLIAYTVPMSIHSWDPVHWPTRTIIAQTSEVIQELARKSAGTTTAYRLVLGRCLLVIDENRFYQSLGFSSSIHYAIQALGLTKREAYETRRVAFDLESLPQLREAAELGQVSWSKLREVTRKASAETEEVWRRLCARKNYHEVEALCRATEYGKLPWNERSEPEAPSTCAARPSAAPRPEGARSRCWYRALAS